MPVREEEKMVSASLPASDVAWLDAKANADPGGSNRSREIRKLVRQARHAETAPINTKVG